MHSQVTACLFWGRYVGWGYLLVRSIIINICWYLQYSTFLLPWFRLCSIKCTPPKHCWLHVSVYAICKATLPFSNIIVKRDILYRQKWKKTYFCCNQRVYMEVNKTQIAHVCVSVELCIYMKQRWLIAFWNDIQTHKSLKGVLI